VNVELTPDEFKKLLELAYLGEWMVNAQHDSEYQDDEADATVQRLLSASPFPGIERDVETGQYFMHSEWTDRLYEDHIVDYDDHVFWDELAERLALRDLAKRQGTSSDLLSPDEDLPALRALEERYQQEFEDHGLDRLEISPEF
jgi:hypothetical protein